MKLLAHVKTLFGTPGRVKDLIVSQDRLLEDIAALKQSLGLEVDRLTLQQERILRSLDDLTRLTQRFSHDSREKLAHEIVQSLGYRGDDRNSLFRAFVGTEEPIASPPFPVPFSSTLCQQAHFGLDQYRFWAKTLKDKPQYQRKQWEFIYIAQVLFERGFLLAGKRGLVFGAGREPLPSLFASFGVEIVASDQSALSAAEGGWVKTNQHTFDLSALNSRGICTQRMFDELVSFEEVDMNDVPASLDGRFDFCWSACSLEHLGSLRQGLNFIRRAMAVLQPGGLAVHTTEFNLTSNTHTIESEDLSLFRRRDIEQLLAELTSEGFLVSPIDWSAGEGFAETVVDLPPFDGRGEPHLRLKIGDYTSTSIGIIVERPKSVQGSAATGHS